MKIIATLEARMSSTRLPGKPLMYAYEGMTLIDLAVQRLKRVRSLHKIIVATTTRPADDVIDRYCRNKGYLVYRGSEENVLERICLAIKDEDCTHVLQAGVDSPMFDDEIIMLGFSRVNLTCVDLYLSDYKNSDLPLGIYYHICRKGSLLKLLGDKRISNKQKEDVVRGFWELDGYDIDMELCPPEHLKIKNVRLTVDYYSDLVLLRSVLAVLGPFCTYRSVRELFQRESRLNLTNISNVQASAPPS